MVSRILGVFKNARIVYIGLIGLIIAIGIIWGIDIRIEKSKVKKASVQSAENVKVLEELGKLVDLPSDETPVIATVIDKSKLNDEPFFTKAVNDDVVVIYQKAKVAYIYRPSTHKVIDFTRVALADNTVNNNQGMSNATTNSSQSEANKSNTETTLTIKIYNGNETTDYASVMEPVIKEKYGNNVVVSKAGLTTGRYSETLVCMTSENYRTKAEEIALMSGGTINTCPPGENSTDANIVLILAQ